MAFQSKLLLISDRIVAVVALAIAIAAASVLSMMESSHRNDIGHRTVSLREIVGNLYFQV